LLILLSLLGKLKRLDLLGDNVMHVLVGKHSSTSFSQFSNQLFLALLISSVLILSNAQREFLGLDFNLTLLFKVDVLKV